MSALCCPIARPIGAGAWARSALPGPCFGVISPTTFTPTECAK
jgi:hypothetical protein